MSKLKQKTKKQKSLIITIGVIGILIIGLIGIYFLNNNSEENVVVIVNDQEITSKEVDMIQQSLLQQGQQISEKDAIEQAINQEILIQEAQKEGITITTEQAESIIKQQLSTQGLTLEDYKQQLETQDISYEEGLDSIKNQLIIQNYLENIYQLQEFNITEEEINQSYNNLKQQLSMMSEEQQENITDEDLRENAELMAEQQKKQQIIGSLIQELREKYNIEYLEEPEQEDTQNLVNEDIEEISLESGTI